MNTKSEEAPRDTMPNINFSVDMNYYKVTNTCFLLYPSEMKRRVVNWKIYVHIQARTRATTARRTEDVRWCEFKSCNINMILHPTHCWPLVYFDSAEEHEPNKISAARYNASNFVQYDAIFTSLGHPNPLPPLPTSAYLWSI